MIFGGLFKDVVIDPAALARNRARPLPGLRYVIHFTPRSGSSWLTDVLTSARLLGRPNEWFNPNFIPNIANVVQARTLDDYVEAVQRQSSTRGIFGAEMTAHQALAVFGSYRAFHRHFGDVTDFWLIRKDIVLQAVSLYKMVSTGVSHTPATSDSAVQQADATFAYDAGAIRKWLRHIWVAETETEAYFRDFDRTPIRLCYEVLTPLPPHRVQTFFAHALRTGHTFTGEAAAPPRHDRIRTDKNREFADRFRAENAAFLAEVEQERMARLKMLRHLRQTLAAADLPERPPARPTRAQPGP